MNLYRIDTTKFLLLSYELNTWKKKYLPNARWTDEPSHLLLALIFHSLTTIQ